MSETRGFVSVAVVMAMVLSKELSLKTKEVNMFKSIKVLLAVLAIATWAWAQTNWTGLGTESNPWVITTPEGLQELADLVNAYGSFSDGKYFALGSDINLGGGENNQWTPIGFDDFDPHPFNGVFDGGKFTVSGIYIDDKDNNDKGLFGYVGEDATIKNLGVAVSHIKGYVNVGGLAGWNEGTIENSHATGNVYGYINVGGLVGENKGTIKNCYATGNVEGKDDDGNIGGFEIGGLVGMNSRGVIENCYATGNVKGGDDVGGLAGGSGYGTIRNCYATGNVTGNDKVGGLAGSIRGYTQDDELSIIENCYAVGSVTGTDNDGGLVGSNDDGTITNSYYSGQPNNGEGTPKTIAEMKLQTTYSSWDFTSIWGIAPAINGGYPYLRSLTQGPSPIISPRIATGNKALQTRNGINLTAANNATLEVYGLNGSLVIRRDFASGVHPISLGHLPRGLYIVKVSFGSGKEVMRVLVR